MWDRLFPEEGEPPINIPAQTHMVGGKQVFMFWSLKLRGPANSARPTSSVAGRMDCVTQRLCLLPVFDISGEDLGLFMERLALGFRFLGEISDFLGLSMTYLC